MSAEQKRWEEAIKKAREMLELYKTIPTGFFGSTVIATLISRFENGERSDTLLDELEGIE